MKPYPVEFRHRVIDLHRQGWTTQRIRQALGVSRAWVDAIKRLNAAGRPLDIKSSANRRTALAERHGDRITARVAEHPGTTLAELKADLGLIESVGAICKALRALGLTLKKSPSGPPSGTARMSPGNGPSGKSPGPASTRGVSCSSTKRSAPPR